jgi:uncharacterized MAPEG superfamily protein
MSSITAIPTGLVTLFAVIFYFFAGARVGILRGRHGIKAPACSGHPAFDRAYRVQVNTLEQLGIFLPLLWLTALFPVGLRFLAPAIGLVWILARILYSRAYLADPETRVIWAGLGGLCNLALLITAATGLIRAILAS